jgi:hypothetical protein
MLSRCNNEQRLQSAAQQCIVYIRMYIYMLLACIQDMYHVALAHKTLSVSSCSSPPYYTATALPSGMPAHNSYVIGSCDSDGFSNGCVLHGTPYNGTQYVAQCNPFLTFDSAAIQHCELLHS